MSGQGTTLTRAVVQTVVRTSLETKGNGPDGRPYRLVVIRGSYPEANGSELVITVNESRRRLTVVDQQSVLGIVEAWEEHRAADHDDDEVLVVTTEATELGWDLLGHAAGHKVLPVDRAEVLKQLFQAGDLDPRIRQTEWLVEALLAAEPAGGWRPVGSLLSFDAAVSALIGERLGTAGGQTSSDIGALLEWVTTPAGPDRYRRLSHPERQGIREWIGPHAGSEAALLLRLVEDGRGADVLPLGLICAGLEAAAGDLEFALGALLGPGIGRAEVRSFGRATQGAMERWIAEVAGRGPSDRARRVAAILRRADELAAAAGLGQALAGSWLLPSAFLAAGHDLAAALDAAPTTGLDPIRRQVDRIETHVLARLEPHRKAAARAALRLAAWLGTEPTPPSSVAAAIASHMNDWGWVDRALTTLDVGDAGGDPVLAEAYRRLHERCRERRDRLDHAAAERLAGWVAHARSGVQDGCLLVEDVLERIVRPWAQDGRAAPLVILLDGMSTAVAVGLGGQLAERGWSEAVPGHQRQRLGAVAVLPTITRLSRTSLLTGTLTGGDQKAERDGFEAFWRLQHRAARLFHKADLPGPPGHRLAPALVEALSGEGVVGVVLNTIDDALDHGRTGDRLEWPLDDVTYLGELLDAARETGRPVMLVSDHGHVPDRSGSEEGPTRINGATSARWRRGGPGYPPAAAGEIAVSGPRVLEGDGQVVLPWREDLRYTNRRAGYHGGASLAELTVPVLVLLPYADTASETLPAGWNLLPVEDAEPAWWSAPSGDAVRVAAPAPVPVPPSRVRPVPQGETLFDPPGVASPAAGQAGAAASLGGRVVASEVYRTNRSLVRKPPAPTDVAAVIDSLVAADCTLSLTAVAEAAGRAGRNPQGLLSMLQRLLNVESYQVLELIDGGRTVRLNLDLLLMQFGVHL